MDYIDSSVIIAAYFPSDPNHKEAEKLMEKVKSGKLEAVISIFGLAEIGGFISRNSSPKDALDFLQELIKIPNLYVWYALDFEDFMNSCVAISISKGLPGADSIHFVSAISIPEVKRLITLDKDFKKVKDMIEVVKPDGSEI
jgi:predicted nucleic acid-binding protein